MKYTIYMHKNKLNNKVYIGQTIQNPPAKRWKNGKAYKPCTYFYRAIQEYGWDNFEHIILVSKEMDTEQANELENYYINFYESRNPDKGYNINAGGYQSISPLAEEKAVEWMKSHPEFGLARAQDMLNWQKAHPEEAALYRKQNAQKAAEARKKPVMCIETEIIYESASEAARQVPGTSQGKICMVCRGQRNTCGGYHWKYVNEN